MTGSNQYFFRTRINPQRFFIISISYPMSKKCCQILCHKRMISFKKNRIRSFFPLFSQHWIKSRTSSHQTYRCYDANKNNSQQDSVGNFFQKKGKIIPDHSYWHKNHWDCHCSNQCSNSRQKQRQIIVPVSCQKQGKDNNQSSVLGISLRRVK